MLSLYFSISSLWNPSFMFMLMASWFPRLIWTDRGLAACQASRRTLGKYRTVISFPKKLSKPTCTARMLGLCLQCLHWKGTCCHPKDPPEYRKPSLNIGHFFYYTFRWKILRRSLNCPWTSPQTWTHWSGERLISWTLLGWSRRDFSASWRRR